MNTRSRAHFPILTRAWLPLCLVAALAVTGCVTRGRPTPEPTTPPPIAPRAVAAGAVPLPPGGTRGGPPGALPPDAQIRTSLAKTPLLPDDVESVGDALAISATVQPVVPVALRLAVPAGVTDPTDLVIVRVEPNGSTTFLMSDVADNEVIAATPGFSTFLTARVPADQGVDLIGDAQLRQGEQSVYYIAGSVRTEEGVLSVPRLQGTVWRILGSRATLVYTSDNAAIVQAGDREGFEILCSETIDYAHGRRWVGCRTLYVTGGAADKTPKLTVNTWTPVVAAREPLRITAGLYGAFQTPIIWEWDFGDGTTGRLTDSNDTRLELPSKRYTTRDLPRKFSVTVTATDANGVVASGGLDIRVTDAPFRVALAGPQVLAWQEGGVTATYIALAADGETPYEYAWQLPGGQPSSLAYTDAPDHWFIFPEPGGFRLEVVAHDFADKHAAAFLPILVEGGEALTTRWLDLPTTAKPGVEVAANVQIRGGVLVVSGKKAGYTLQVDWGDGSPALWLENVGSDRTPSQGTAVPVAHTYTQPRTYTVRITAYDSTGALATEAREIVVAEAQAVAPPPAPGPNTPPTAEDIASNTRSGEPVMITLKGADADGDALTYTIVQEPVHGTRSGDPPFLTYTPNSGFIGTETFTYRVNDGQADSPPATVSVLVEALRPRWVREGEPLINATEPKAPLEYYGGGSTPGYFTEPRFEGKFTVYRLSETLIAVDDREVDHGYEYYNVTIETRFDAPPPAIIPGAVVTLTAAFASSGTVTEGNPGAIFQYGADRGHSGIVQPAEPLSYAMVGYAGPTAKTWTLTAPQGQPGDTFQVWAGWWNCPMCNVTWTYRYQAE